MKAAARFRVVARFFTIALVGGSLACALGCTKQIGDPLNHIAPPVLRITGSSQVVTANGQQTLVVTAALRNDTQVHFQLAVEPSCALYVRIFSDPTGEQQGSSGTGCPVGVKSIDFAPGDSTSLTRTYSMDDLSSYAAGLYGLNITVTTNTYILGAWAGAVRLPLGSAPQP
ncbi:MAG: hypothetical protein ABI442_19905 [Gemmatimonadaceae bacterium]